jgi:hypothetical protein
MSFPKHERAPRKGAKKPPQPAVDAAPEVRAMDVAYDGLSEVAAQLEEILKVFGAYHYNATIGENSLNLITGRNSPAVRLSLEGDAVGSIADSLKRIADAIAARVEGTHATPDQ